MMRLQWFVEPPLITVASALSTSARYAVVAKRCGSSDEQFEALCNAEAELVVTSMDNVIAWNRRNGPGDFCIIAQVERTTPLSLFAQPGINNATDLRGGIVLVDAPSNGFVIALRALLLEAGLSSDDYTLAPAGGVMQRLQALQAGQGHCTLLGPPFDDMALQAGFSKLASVQERYPHFPGQGLVTRKSFISALRSELTAWLQDLATAASLLANEHPSARQALCAAAHPAAVLPSIASLGPRQLAAERPGIELLIAMRQRLALEGADDSYASLTDASLLPST
jgi:ABC-type nitrate/sulfonate/bicarbonate transport system substrate-binding protein